MHFSRRYMSTSCRTVVLLFCIATCHASPVAAQSYDLVIKGGQVMDPESGLDAVRHIGVSDGTIQIVSETPLDGRDTIDAVGLVVAPGFIDLNIHETDLKTSKVRVLDGVTSGLEMESPPADIDRWYSEQIATAVINHGTAVGYWRARLDVMGDKSLEGTAQWTQMEHSKATPEQIKAILHILDEGLAHGAVGIGIPLEYMPAATQIEVLEVFRMAARHGAPAHIHMRSWGYDEKRIRSYGDLYEVLGAAIATDASIQVLHINSSYNEWTPVGLELITKAQARGLPVTTEMYPYAFGGCRTHVAYFDDWETYPDEYFSTKLRLASTGEWLTKEKFRKLREGDEEVKLICYDNTEEMVRLALTSPLTMIASDGGGENPHPRTAGTYSRVLGHYVRDEKQLALMDALGKMTIMPARHLQKRVPSMQRKGRIQAGADADITIFDPARIIDQATVLEPMKPSVGVRHVIVNGVPVVREGAVKDGVYPGRAIRAPQGGGNATPN